MREGYWVAGRSGFARTIFDVAVGLVGMATGILGVWQFWVPSLQSQAFEQGKKEIAQEVVSQLSEAGFDIQTATVALNAGDIDKAVELATSATLAKPVAIAPAVPFELKENAVIDLASGQLISFRIVSDMGDYATIRIRADDQVSQDLNIGESMIIGDDSKCRIEVLAVRKVDSDWVASLRDRC